MKTLLSLSFLLIAAFAGAQQTVSAIRGTITDKQSQYPIIGATIIVSDLQPVLGATTDIDGRFRIDAVPVGRHTVTIQYTGDEPQTLSQLLVVSGKDLELNIQLEESVTQLNAVEIVAEDDKTESLNKMSSVSTRSFSLEEARRYSGSLQDPARMVQNYAGVSNASDDRNDIIIRGNSPTGVLWRLEGIDIPNPSHFSTLGTTGGPVSILNANNLANSDFSTSA
ncbi:MAG: carboxypeptidase regulatory-like domain-containing protein, partial [Bacteroidota bacterium]